MIPSITSKLKSELTTSPKDTQRVKRACSTAASCLQAILQIAKDLAGSAGVPGLQAGIGGLLVVLDVVRVCYYLTVMEIRC
jgi:hypothetical protein